MCSVCNRTNFIFDEKSSLYKNELGMGKNIHIYLETKDFKNFMLQAIDDENNNNINYITYVCPTCGKRF
jgi:uncharacterized protein (DUF2344 family)